MKEVHICPILMRTVMWEDWKCTENCEEQDCPIKYIIEEHNKEELLCGNC